MELAVENLIQPVEASAFAFENEIRIVDGGAVHQHVGLGLRSNALEPIALRCAPGLACGRMRQQMLQGPIHALGIRYQRVTDGRLANIADDAGRDVVTLDTRNAFEVDFGRFTNAIDWRIARFGEFPAAARNHLRSLENKTVVSYCTGGIRCEKAAIYLRELGLENVFQLEGGILRYFEEAGNAHFQGDCFVFDEREALHADLSPTKLPAAKA